MDNTTIMAAAAKLHKCADELAEIAQLLGATAKAVVSPDEVSDDHFQRALECIRTTHRASISHFQRRLGYSYNHSAKLMDRLEKEGYVLPANRPVPREINWDKFRG